MKVKIGKLYYVNDPDIDKLIVKVLEKNADSPNSYSALVLKAEGPRGLNGRFNIGNNMVVNTKDLVELKDKVEEYKHKNGDQELINISWFDDAIKNLKEKLNDAS